MARIVLTDASPLIGLSIVDGLNWLHTLFGEVWMPEEVKREVLPGTGFKGEEAIHRALDAGWLREWTQGVEALHLPELDEGEAACLAIATAHNGDSLILMDERAGRAIAAELHLKVAGTAAIVGMAKARGLIPSARQVFETLHQSDFRISAQVIKTVLERTGE